MKIMHVSYYTELGGVENYNRDLFTALEQRGHFNTVLYGGTELPNLACNGRQVVRLEGIFNEGDRPHRLVGADISRMLSACSPDVIFIHCPIDSAAAWRLRDGYPTVYFAHNYNPICASGAFLYEKSDSICQLRGTPDWRCWVNAYAQKCNTRRPDLLRTVYQHSKRIGAWVRHVDEIVCDTEYVRRRYADNGFDATRIHALPSPIPIPPEADIGSWPREPLVLFAGRVTPQKGLDYLLQAFLHVDEPVTLTVAGDGYELSRMHNLAARLGITRRVTFLGAANRSEVNALYARASVVVVPSVWPEPFGMVGPEAMSYGTPVVAFNVGGIPEWLDDEESGYLVQSRDIVGLAHQIDRLIADPDLARRLGERGRQVAEERYTLDRHVSGLLTVFQAAIHRHSEKAPAHAEI